MLRITSRVYGDLGEDPRRSCDWNELSEETQKKLIDEYENRSASDEEAENTMNMKTL